MAFFQSIFCGSVKLCLVGLLVGLGSVSAVRGQVSQARPVMRDDLARNMLTHHNAERATLRLDPLIWDQVLAKDAARWALTLAANKRFEHATAELQRTKQGENLWMGTAKAYSYAEMLSFWLDERKMAKSGVFPQVSRTGNWADVGHYTQMIWPATRKIGCAVASTLDDDFLVCRYFPAGNRIGDTLNVKRSK
jgi:Cysteine-rich secretory protein family